MLRKLVVAVVFVVALGWLFWQSVQSSLSEPYVVRANLVSEWQLVLRGPLQAGVGLLVLQPSDQLRAELFQQIFNRTMESMTSPVTAAMPIVLHDEYQAMFGEGAETDELRSAAVKAGLEDAVPTPVCIGVVRKTITGGSRQLYYALFEEPAVDRFRSNLAVAGGGELFSRTPFALVVPLASSDANFASWFPLKVTAADCLAPIKVG